MPSRWWHRLGPQLWYCITVTISVLPLVKAAFVGALPKSIEFIHMDFECLSLADHPGNLPDAVALTFSVIEGGAAHFERFGVACPASVARAVLKRKAEYLAGRRVALQALRKAGIETSDMGIGLMGAPNWPSGYTGSITHSENMAVAVAMPASEVQGVGIDLEKFASAHAISAIQQVVLSPAEMDALYPLTLHFGPPAAATIAFSAKESFYKATAALVGRIFDFSAVRITSACTDLGVIEARVAETLTTGIVSGRIFSMGFSVLDNEAVITSCVW
ncbi:MAG TPA: 4'-phosphopantetheinyl transferase superfamily protein [Dyella sp.]|uniref:4'-phosphopantetheinyl transferase family protein n=1 Tax=Dyella sp. TaxID=1869338 RepID=UPI002C920DE2|nr:4'-phosphopantetheinyl transferase superfamily protein [Dyella sp.]HTV87183.1 4'-phosphopantetheinyl transferase superfamily protein [Dyella sp.]